MTPHEVRAQDQKYRPRRRLNSRNKEMLISTPMYHAMPVKAAMIMASGKSSLMAVMMYDAACCWSQFLYNGAVAVSIRYTELSGSAFQKDRMNAKSMNEEKRRRLTAEWR